MFPSVKINKPDFRSALMLYLPKRLSKLTIICFVLTLYFIISDDILSATPLIACLIFLIPLSVLTSTLRFKKVPLFRSEISFSWDEAGLSLSGQAGHWTHLWSDIRGYLENGKSIVYILANGCGFIFIPKRAFANSEQMQSLRETMAVAHLKKLRKFP